MKEQWVYMIGDEHISEFFETKQEAIDEGLSVYGEDEWHNEKELSVGTFVNYQPTICVEGLIERWQEDVYDDYYDCGNWDSYLEGVTREQSMELEEELNDVLFKWLQKHNLKANFGEVVSWETIKE